MVDGGGVEVRFNSDLYHIFGMVDVGGVEVRLILTSTTFLQNSSHLYPSHIYHGGRGENEI